MTSKAVNDANSHYQMLVKEWTMKSPDLKKCGILLDKLKVLLTSLEFLPTNQSVTPKELILSRDVLEIGALYSIKVKDIPSFERYLAQLKCYYFDYK